MDWSNNPIKLARARGNLGPNATEEELKAEYIRIGGYVTPEYQPVTVDVPSTIEVTQEGTVQVTVPKKVTKKKNVSKPRVLVAKKKATKAKRKA